ncbi:MAG TPA: hypothetical protein VMG12_40505 [Polyangiaceae bacterium]|nr:hypothetical protein [Polyangiaceae bacterium]
MSPFERLGDGDDGLDRPSAISGCLPVRQRPTLTIGADGEAELAADETWSCRNNYWIAAPLFVRSGVSLAIGPDTRIVAGTGAYVLVERGARLVAEGTREAPIVFTSAQPIGSRAPGDWKGIMLAGSAPTHVANATLPGSVSDARAYFGGGPSGAADHDCGRLRFVRIEFAGGSTDEEATPGAALSLGGCGATTTIDFVQVHRATDGIGILGGTLGIAHAVVSNNGFGNAIEWTAGYTGRLQQVVVQGSGTGAALKGSNSESDPALLPVSHPVLYNISAVGIGPLIPSGAHYGLLLQHGSAATLRNSIIAHFDDAAIVLESEPTIVAATPDEIGYLTLFDNGPDGMTHLPRAAAALQSDSLRIRDPGLDAATRLDRPDFVPTDAGVMSNIAVTPAGFDPTATYRGALPFGGEDWTLGWTDYPLD